MNVVHEDLESKFDQHRAAIREQREGSYGQQWIRHLDRFGLPAYFYELVGILGRLESMIIDDYLPPGIPGEVVVEEIQDKLMDLGNYAGFMYDWIELEKERAGHQTFKERLP